MNSDTHILAAHVLLLYENVTVSVHSMHYVGCNCIPFQIQFFKDVLIQQSILHNKEGEFNIANISCFMLCCIVLLRFFTIDCFIFLITMIAQYQSILFCNTFLLQVYVLLLTEWILITLTTLHPFRKCKLVHAKWLIFSWIFHQKI